MYAPHAALGALYTKSVPLKSNKICSPGQLANFVVVVQLVHLDGRGEMFIAKECLDVAALVPKSDSNLKGKQ